jgi:DNA-binding NtrC family response regulator
MDYRCAIVEAADGSEAGGQLLAALERVPDVLPSRQRFDEPPRAPAADVVLALVRPQDCGLALDWLARRGAGGCAVVAVGVGLDGAQIEAVLAAGAVDYLSLPHLGHELAARLHRALGLLAAAPRPRALADARLNNFIGSSAVFRQQVAKAVTYAGCDAGVLITGDTGTGKEVCAQAIHYLSARASGPWVAVNCGAIPSELIESELFGHVRGAFTHAQAARQGLVREAEGGTLFLDDIDCMPLAAQAKLLRFLQEGEYRLVGANALQRADVRVIASSNRRLGELAAGGTFRQDLYFRLAVLTLTLPPLRERREDIVPLALHFLRSVDVRRGARPGGLGPAALAKLLAHDWPGNVRELKHVIERALVLARGAIVGADEIDFGERQQLAAIDVAGSFREAKARLVEDFERNYIEGLLATHGGNVTHAAQAAHKNRRAFFELMRKYRIDATRFRGQFAG